jgi:NAD(P)-dependent dehydrogenase (short-subunit alcohol dehydrogenase family)
MHLVPRFRFRPTGFSNARAREHRARLFEDKMANQKTALVTGANKGIGRQIARRLAELGYVVQLGCRDAGRGEEAAAALRKEGGDVRFLQLDVADDASVTRAAAALSRETDRLDVLVNNAGIAGQDVAPSVAAIEAMKAVYEVNVFGAVRVTQAFLPLLRAAAAARIVMMSSYLGSLTRTSDPSHVFHRFNPLAYNSSKTALNAVTVIFARELRDSPIKVNAAAPGYTATDLNRHSGTRTVAQAAAIAVRLATLPDDGPTGGYFDDEGPVAW